MRIGSLQVEVRRRGRRRVVRADLTAKLPMVRVRVAGGLLHAVTRALELSRRDQRSWAVLQAARGQYELVPLSLAGSSKAPDVDELAELVRAPGVTQVSIARLTGQLVAIAGLRTPHVFNREVLTLPKPR